MPSKKNTSLYKIQRDGTINIGNTYKLTKDIEQFTRPDIMTPLIDRKTGRQLYILKDTEVLVIKNNKGNELHVKNGFILIQQLGTNFVSWVKETDLVPIRPNNNSSVFSPHAMSPHHNVSIKASIPVGVYRTVKEDDGVIVYKDPPTVGNKNIKDILLKQVRIDVIKNRDGDRQVGNYYLIRYKALDGRLKAGWIHQKYIDVSRIESVPLSKSVMNVIIKELEIHVPSNINKLIDSYKKLKMTRPPLTNTIERDRYDTFNDTLNKIKTNFPYKENIRVYSSNMTSIPYSPLFKKTTIGFGHYDSLATMNYLFSQSDYPHVAIVDFANIHSPGGTPFRGSSAQEEKIAYRTSVFAPLYTLYIVNCDKSSVLYKMNQQHSLLGPAFSREVNHFFPETGGVYMPGIDQFKEYDAVISGEDQITIRNITPIKVNIIASAAFNMKDRERKIGGLTGKDRHYYQTLTMEKIRAQLRIAILNNNHHIIVGAFGAGAFKNDPQTIASFYLKVLLEKEFYLKFKTVIFSIYSPRLPNNNFNIFTDYFIKNKSRLPEKYELTLF